MSRKLYVTNFAPDATEDQLHDLFSQYGEVQGVRLGTDENSGEPYAVVELASEKNATKAYNGLNGFELAGRHLTVSYPEVDVTRELTSKQRKIVAQVLTELDESEKVPVRQIEAMARLCGTGFVQAIAEEALEVEAGGSLMTSDGTRKRTKGGVFFYLARYRMAPPVRRIVYTRKGKFPPPDET